MSHARLDQLSDSIFAIVMTILVFEIRLPTASGFIDNINLWIQVKVLFPVLLTYILSFATLFTYWRAHHFFISVYAKNIDSTLVNINGIFFMLISLVPFSASVLAQYNHNELSVVIFGVHTVLIGLTLYWMRRYVLFSPHIQNPEINKREIRGSTIRTLFPVLCAILAIPFIFYSIKLAIILLTLAIIFNLSSYSTRLFEKILKTLHRLFLGGNTSYFAD